MRTLRHHAKGDTIVEVLIAIAVVSSVLGITYATMNRNVQIGRDNQERTEASKLVQGQIEALKNLSGFNLAALNAQGSEAFCLNNLTIVDLNMSGAIPAVNSDNYANYPPACIRSGLYHLSVQFDPGENVYRIRARWDGLTGRKNEVAMAYRN